MIMRLLLFISVLSIFYSCKKYSRPSEPKIQGQWQITLVDFYRIEDSDTVNELHYYPGEMFVLPDENNPLDTINVGQTFFSCSGAEILFKPYFGYGGRTFYSNSYFYTISEVNFEYPGFISFDTEKRRNVWKIIYTDYSGMLLQMKGQWNPESSFAKKVTIGYGQQRASKYDIIYLKCTRIGP